MNEWCEKSIEENKNFKDGYREALRDFKYKLSNEVIGFLVHNPDGCSGELYRTIQGVLDVLEKNIDKRS